MRRKKQTKKPAAKKAPAKKAKDSELVALPRQGLEALHQYLMTRPMADVEGGVMFLRTYLGDVSTNGTDQSVPGS